MAWHDEDDDVDFNPEEFDEEEGGDIDSLDDLWAYADYPFEDLVEYEFHGTGDTGKRD